MTILEGGLYLLIGWAVGNVTRSLLDMRKKNKDFEKRWGEDGYGWDETREASKQLAKTVAKVERLLKEQKDGGRSDDEGKV